MGIGLPLEKVAELARAVVGIRYVKEEAPPSGQRITKLTELAGDSLAAVFGIAGYLYWANVIAPAFPLPATPRATPAPAEAPSDCVLGLIGVTLSSLIV